MPSQRLWRVVTKACCTIVFPSQNLEVRTNYNPKVKIHFASHANIWLTRAHVQMVELRPGTTRTFPPDQVVRPSSTAESLALPNTRRTTLLVLAGRKLQKLIQCLEMWATATSTLCCCRLQPLGV